MHTLHRLPGWPHAFISGWVEFCGFDHFVRLRLFVSWSLQFVALPCGLCPTRFGSFIALLCILKLLTASLQLLLLTDSFARRLRAPHKYVSAPIYACLARVALHSTGAACVTPRSAPPRGARRRVLKAWRSTAVESAAPRGLCPASPHQFRRPQCPKKAMGVARALLASCRADSAEHDAAFSACLARRARIQGRARPLAN